MQRGVGAWHGGVLGAPVRMLLDALWLQWRIVLLPWQALVFWLSCCSEMLVKLLTMAGVPPISHKDRLKLVERQKIIEHLHQREDGYRRKIRELSTRLDARTREARKLEAKLARAQQEAAAASALPRADGGQVALGGERNDRVWLVKHAFFLVAGVLPMYWLLQQPDVPPVSRKFGWSIMLPEALLYIFSLLGNGPRSTPGIIQCCSLFLSGFVFCHWLHKVN